MHQHAAQHGVLDDVCEVSGVKGVAVIHARWLRHRGLKVTTVIASGAKQSRSYREDWIASELSGRRDASP
jgi:hypothetical protein